MCERRTSAARERGYPLPGRMSCARLIGLRAGRTSTTGRRSQVTNVPGFTLIELLVVIAVIAVLIAILVPSLARARRQAQALACQANLKQWGVRVEAAASENDTSLRQWDNKGNIHEVWSFNGDLPPVENRSRDMRFCPIARRLANEVIGGDQDSQGQTTTGHGGTFLAWGPIFPPEVPSPYGSYGLNGGLAAGSTIGWTTGKTGNIVDVRGQARIPVLLDSVYAWTQISIRGDDAPPACDAIPTATGNKWNGQSCINRHDGGVNCLFFDWSVRKVGLKELWALKWYPQYDTAGQWTKAGGVQPQDWPEWMRRFKDY